MKALSKIVCVEDDRSIQLVIKLALEDVGGLKVKLYSGGEEALGCIETEQPQLIILDVMMPGMDGIETLERLRKIPQLANVPVIFMTAKANPEEVSSYLDLGVQDVIMKPFDPMTLAEKVTGIWQSAA